ncbi:hypothetical protein A0257_05740 [Hymenobacter psoromatis]|nr:hypothetical protein A0257_05740 [Hymenobacter psoromatis]
MKTHLWATSPPRPSRPGFPPLAMHPNFAERLFSSLLADPARTVLRWPDPRPGASATTLSGAELLGRVRAWQQALERAGPLPPGAPVLLAQPGSPELVAALLAVLGLGAVPVLPPAGATARQLLALLRAERIGHVATTPGARCWLAGPGRLLGCRCVAAAPAAGELVGPPLPPLLRPVPPGQAALVSHSSGSASGRPTAVRRSHAVLQQQHEALRRQFPPWAGQRDFPLFPNVILHNLAVGALSVVPDLARGLARLAPGRVLAQLAAEQVQTLTGNVFYFNALLTELHRQPATFPAVRALGVGGSPVPEQLLAALRPWFPRATLHVIYGASEAEPIAVRNVVDTVLDPRRGYCVGPPVAGLRVRLRQPAPVWLPAPTPPLPGGPLPTPVAGEILVAGPHVARPTGAPEYLATGDYGYFDAAGQLWLVGRRGAAGLVRGVGHYQLEHYLRQLPGVAQVAARPLAHGGQFELFVVGSRPAAALRDAVAEAFGEGLLGPVRYRPRLPVDGRHLSKIRYDLLG